MAHNDTSCKLVEMVEAGELSAHTVMLACLTYMSNDAVDDMANLEELVPVPEMATYEVYTVVDRMRKLVAVYGVEDDDLELDALEFGEDYSHEHEVMTVVDKVTDNGGCREEIERFA